MTTNYVTYQSSAAPTLFITRNKQRVKQHGRTVYLKDGQEFELELFNPTQNKILAKLKLNGTDIGAGIVLRPGERVFLERYLNEARKFVFSTYHVDGNDPNVQRAIQQNGKVDVEFYDEYKQPNIWISGSSTWRDPNTFYCSGDVTYYDSPTTFTSSDNTQNLNFSNDSNTKAFPFISQEMKRETGRVEKGSYSSQQIEYDDTQFNAYPTWSDSWKIMPVSQKVAYTREEIAVYCTNCGAKRKKTSHKFCPHCGTKY